jgi:hypothetical protein
MATRNSSEVQRRRLRVRCKRAKTRPPTQTSDAAMGSSRPRKVPSIDEEFEPEQDDTLVLLFMCSHPSLTAPSAIALTLRAVGGLTTREIGGHGSGVRHHLVQRVSRRLRLDRSSHLRRARRAEAPEWSGGRPPGTLPGRPGVPPFDIVVNDPRRGSGRGAHRQDHCVELGRRLLLSHDGTRQTIAVI